MHMKKFLKDKYNVVVDRCNFDVDQRKTWLDLGKEFDVPVDCIVLTTTQEECSQRIIQRENHPTDVAGPKGVGILKKFVQNYQPPTHDTNEGFDKLLYVDPSEEPECTEERINIILDLLEKTPSLLIEPTVTSE
ncbi:hypothetical protein BJ944DRAFT_203653 [Cunninghamella echinulata]|nr:hypothetical protein BJ944DRAFT_203653 [Cunninghamella echinulata]